MAAPLDPQTIEELLSPELNRLFFEAGEEHPAEYIHYLTVFDMDHNPIKDQRAIGLGIMGEKSVGGAFPRDQIKLKENMSTAAKPYGSAVELTFEALDDELYGLLRVIPQQQGRGGRRRLEVAAARVLNSAFDNTFNGFVSGEALLDDHVGDDGVTRSNMPTPAIGFSMTGIQQMVLHGHNMTDDRGNPEQLSFNKILITATNLFAAREILGSAGKPFSADNEINSLVAEELNWMVVHFMTSAQRWIGLAREHDLRFGFRNRPMQTTYADPSTWNVVSVAYQRHTESYFGSWRGTYGSDPDA